MRTLDPIWFREAVKRIADARVEDFNRPDGTFKPVNEWTEDQGKVVKEVTVVPGTNRVIDVKLENQAAARRLLARLPR